MQDFATLRGVDYGKLSRGLGLEAMSVPDVHEDPATMAANAIVRLIDRNNLDPRSIGRLYLGTESALDGAKPTATYILDMLTQRYAPTYGPDCFVRCDAVDLTFACIGAVDALHNTLDWVARAPEDDRIGIVAFSDNAKYERNSPGEYTQGAGGGAMIVRQDPRLLAIGPHFGVCTRPVHDFFKPRREMPVRDLLSRVLASAKQAGADVTDGILERMLEQFQADGDDLFDAETIAVHKDTPLFDGQLSNQYYRDAVKGAFAHFREQALESGRLAESDPILTDQWSRIVMHLPYAFQGKRMFPDIYRHDRQLQPEWRAMEAKIGLAPSRSDFEDGVAYEAARESYRRAVSKTAEYAAFAQEKIERGQRASSLVGNQYTGSLFLALMSTLEADLDDETVLEGTNIGICGYGSGAKAKVFEGTVQPGWRAIASQFRLVPRLAERTPIDGALYERLHRCQECDSVVSPHGEFVLQEVRSGDHEGQRVYAWVDEPAGSHA
ncbi:MAG: hydroxymethylglutaryl-CoA synthase [Myxococcota bacterium]|jgi:hydroxymethylglutaryl-CoA synthase